MTTTEAIKSGAGTLADTATSALSDLADKAKAQADTAKDRITDRKESHRGRTLLLGAALVGAAAAAYRYLRARMGGLGQEPVIDLTQDPVMAPESIPTP